jgi:histidinol-phosphate aminotransferase
VSSVETSVRAGAQDPPAGRGPSSGTEAGGPVRSVRERVRPREDLVALEGYHSPQVAASVRLNTNESPYPPPPSWQEALADEVASIEFHRYPDRTASALRAAIAESHGTTPEHVFVANGSNEVIQTLLLTYAGAGRTVATFEPTYAMHGQIARTVGAALVTGQRGPGFVLDAGELRRVTDAHRPHVTFLCSPNNPTGVIDPPELVREALELSPGVVAVDEAYGQFASWSATELLDDDAALVVIRTFSKTWAMAGARLGYLLGPTWMVDELWKVALPYHLDVIKQAAGRLALRYECEMRRRVEEIVAERDRLIGAMGAMGSLTVWPSQANFILFRPETRAGGDVWAALLERSVLVRNCSSWPNLEGCLRVTVGTPAENDAFLGALREVTA